MTSLEDVGGLPGGATIRAFLQGVFNDDGTLKSGGSGASPDGVTLDASGAGGTLEIKPGGVGTTQLANAGPGATGPIGNSTTVPVITIDAKGRVTALTSSAISAGITTLAVTQVAHGLSVDQAVRCTGASTWVASEADIASHADIDGIVTAVADANDFTVTLAGSLLSGFTGLTAGQDYYLDPATPGSITTTEPTTAGQVSAPIGKAISTTQLLFKPQRGLVVPSAATQSFNEKVLSSSTSMTVGDFNDAAFVIDSDLNGWSLTRIVAWVTTAPGTSVPAVTLKKNGTSMLSTNATIDVGEKTSDTAATAPVIKSDGTQTVATGDVLTPSCVIADSGAADRGFGLKLVFTSP